LNCGPDTNLGWTPLNKTDDNAAKNLQKWWNLEEKFSWLSRDLNPGTMKGKLSLNHQNPSTKPLKLTQLFSPLCLNVVFDLTSFGLTDAISMYIFMKLVRERPYNT
jgi:hypothetical protein